MVTCIGIYTIHGFFWVQDTWQCPGFTKKLKIYSDIVDIADRHQVAICFAVLKRILMASNNVVKAFGYLHVDVI